MRLLYNKKNRAWIKMKKYRSGSNYSIFSIYRNKFKKVLERCYNNYISKVGSSIKDNSKFFWTYLKNRKKISDIPSTVNFKDRVATGPNKVCSIFSSFFHSVFEPTMVTEDFDIQDIIVDDIKISDILINDIKLTILEVTNQLKMLV